MENNTKSDSGIDASSHHCLEIGGRIVYPPSRLLIETAFKEELGHQLHLHQPMGLVDIAHVIISMETAIIPRSAGTKLLNLLLRLHQNPNLLKPDPSRGDLYTNREFWLMKQSPCAMWLGVGRARREATTTAFLIKIRTLLLSLHLLLTTYVDALADQSEKAKSLIMPDYTYLQPTETTSFGHFILTSAFAALRDVARLQELLTRVNLSPAGCGSSNGSRLPQNREKLAELLGFDGVVMHARDAMWQADLPIELVSILGTILISLDRLAEDLQIFSTQEFGFVELHDRHARASKILPQKKNPFALTYIRGISNEIIGISSTVMATGRTCSGQPDNRLTIYGSIPSAVTKTCNAVSLMTEIINDISFYPDAALQRLKEGDVIGNDIGQMLITKCGLAPRLAHQLVGRLTRIMREKKQRLFDITIQDLTQLAEKEFSLTVTFTADALEKAKSPELSVAEKIQTGGCSSDAINRMVNHVRHSLDKHRSWGLQTSKAITDREKALLELVHGMIN